MANDAKERDDRIEPEGQNNSPQADGESAVRTAAQDTPAMSEPRDPAADVPVPIAMSAAEIDERAQVVEALRDASPAADGEPRANA